MNLLKKITLLCSLFLLTLAGCGGGGNEAALVGVWKISSKSSIPGGADAAAAQAMLAGINVDFRADKTYVLNMIMPMEGTWTMDNSGLVTMKTTKVMGQDISKMPGAGAGEGVSCQLDVSNNTLTMQNPTPGATGNTMGSMVFEKQ